MCAERGSSSRRASYVIGRHSTAAGRYQSARELQSALAQWRKSKDGRMELERHKKIMKLRALKAKKRTCNTF